MMTNNNKYDLTLILSFYNEGATVSLNIKKLISLLNRSPLKYEMILIDDKSQDQSAKLIQKTIQGKNNCRFIQHQKNVGRGGSITEGIKLAQGMVVGFIDTDLEISPAKIPEAVNIILSNQADIVTGLRKYEFRFLALHRFFLTKGYHYLVSLVLSLPLKDTETGFKFFKRTKILPILAKTKDKRWFWDTEIMALSYEAKLKIIEIPVEYKHREDKKTSVKLVHDSFDYLIKLIKFRLNILGR